MKCFPPLLPLFFVGRLGHGARNPSRVIVLMQVTQKRGIADVEISMVFEPFTELHSRPMELVGKLG